MLNDARLGCACHSGHVVQLNRRLMLMMLGASVVLEVDWRQGFIQLMLMMLALASFHSDQGAALG